MTTLNDAFTSMITHRDSYLTSLASNNITSLRQLSEAKLLITIYKELGSIVSNISNPAYGGNPSLIANITALRASMLSGIQTDYNISSATEALQLLEVLNTCLDLSVLITER